MPYADQTTYFFGGGYYYVPEPIPTYIYQKLFDDYRDGAAYNYIIELRLRAGSWWKERVSAKKPQKVVPVGYRATATPIGTTEFSATKDVCYEPK